MNPGSSETTLATSIFDIASSFCSIQDVDTLLTHITSAVERLTASEAASILLLDESKKQLVFRAATGEKGSAMKKFYVPVGKGIAGWVAEHGEAVIINDVQSDTRFTGQIDKSSGFSTRSIMAIWPWPGQRKSVLPSDESTLYRQIFLRTGRGGRWRRISTVTPWWCWRPWARRAL